AISWRAVPSAASVFPSSPGTAWSLTSISRARSRSTRRRRARSAPCSVRSRSLSTPPATGGSPSPTSSRASPRAAISKRAWRRSGRAATVTRPLSPSPASISTGSRRSTTPWATPRARRQGVLRRFGQRVRERRRRRRKAARRDDLFATGAAARAREEDRAGPDSRRPSPVARPPVARDEPRLQFRGRDPRRLSGFPRRLPREPKKRQIAAPLRPRATRQARNRFGVLPYPPGVFGTDAELRQNGARFPRQPRPDVHRVVFFGTVLHGTSRPAAASRVWMV